MRVTDPHIGPAPDHLLSSDASVHRKTVVVFRDRVTDRLSAFRECARYGHALAEAQSRACLDAYGPGTRYSYLTTPARLPALRDEMDAQRHRMDYRRTEAALRAFDDGAALEAVQRAFILDTMDRNPPDDWSIVTLDFIRRAVTNWIGHGRPTAEGRHWALLTDKGTAIEVGRQAHVLNEEERR